MIRLPLDHRLLGLDDGRTRLAAAYLVATSLLIAAGAWLWPLFEGAPFLADVVDEFRDLTIIVATATLPLSLAYAAWNGGPALSLAIPLVPVLVGATVVGQLVLDPDFVLALCAGAAAAALATYAAGVRRRDDWRPRPYPGLGDALAVATPAAVVGTVALVRAVPAVGRAARPGFVVARALLVVAAGVLALQWAVWLRGVASERSADGG